MTEQEIERDLRDAGGRRLRGMEHHLVALASRLPPSVRCLVCCLDASGDYQARLTDARIEHANLDWPILLRPGGTFAYLRFERAVRRFRPHIVRSYGFAADVVAGLLRARGSNARVITSRRRGRSELAPSGLQASRQSRVGQSRVRFTGDRGVRPVDGISTARLADRHSERRCTKRGLWPCSRPASG